MMSSSSINARQAKLRAGIETIEDVVVEYLQDIAPETRNTADLSRDMAVDYYILHGVLRGSKRVVDDNPHGRRRAWTVRG